MVLSKNNGFSLKSDFTKKFSTKTIHLRIYSVTKSVFLLGKLDESEGKWERKRERIKN